jgi:hypothetical protein
MKTRNFALCSLGLAAAITLGGAATASAQVRSDTRIPVRKDQQPAEQAPPRVDTIRVVRVDTVTVRGRTDTVTIRSRPDTIREMQMIPARALPGLYFGLGAGGVIPYDSWRNSTKDGQDVQLQVGWFPANGILGLRADGNAALLAERDSDCPQCPKPKVFSGSGDVVLRFPLDRMSKLNPVLYFLGGGGITKFQDFLPYVSRDKKVVNAGGDTYRTYPGLPVTAAASGDKSLFYHWEGGLGLDLDIGALHTFVESKYMSINTNNGNSKMIPIIAGLKFGW